MLTGLAYNACFDLNSNLYPKKFNNYFYFTFRKLKMVMVDGKTVADLSKTSANIVGSLVEIDHFLYHVC